MFDRSTYEVQILMEDHWIYHAEFKREARAMKEAKEIIEYQTFDGAQVVRLWKRGDGEVTEKVIFSEQLPAQQKIVQIVPIEETNSCQELADFYNLESRLTIGRVLRKYIDANSVTPTELLHVYTPLQRFMDSDLYASAADRIATLQVQGTDQDGKDRRDEIYKLVDQIASKSLRAEGRRTIRQCEAEDFKGLAKAAELAVETPDEKDFLLTVVLARETAKQRSLPGKLEFLIELIPDVTQQGHLSVIDGMVAELLAQSQIIQELLGAQTNLCAAICTLLDWVEGRDIKQNGSLPDVVDAMQKLFAAGRLPKSKGGIHEFILRQVQGKGPLARNDHHVEEEAYTTVFKRVFSSGDVIGGPAMAEALLCRYALRLEQGGRTGEDLAFDGVLVGIENPVERVRFLTLFASSSKGPTHAMNVAQRVKAEIDRAGHLDYFCNGETTAGNKLRAIYKLQKMMLESEVDEQTRKVFVERLDTMVAGFLLKEKVIEKLDDENAPLKVRADQLVRFCGSDIVWGGGKAIAMAQKQVIGYLRQADFVERYTKTAESPAQAETMIKEFYQLLSKSGFKT